MIVELLSRYTESINPFGAVSEVIGRDEPPPQSPLGVGDVGLAGPVWACVEGGRSFATEKMW